MESEIFSHKAGAFTGANKDKKGLIEEAHNGILFLNEIGEMPVNLQSKLLCVWKLRNLLKLTTRNQQGLMCASLQLSIANFSRR